MTDHASAKPYDWRTASAVAEQGITQALGLCDALAFMAQHKEELPVAGCAAIASALFESLQELCKCRHDMHAALVQSETRS